MLTGKRFKLSERTLATEVVDRERKAISLPAGAIIKVLSTTYNGERMVDVLWEDRKVEILTCDLEMRGIEVLDPSLASGQPKSKLA